MAPIYAKYEKRNPYINQVRAAELPNTRNLRTFPGAGRFPPPPRGENTCIRAPAPYLRQIRNLRVPYIDYIRAAEGVKYGEKGCVDPSPLPADVRFGLAFAAPSRWLACVAFRV